MRVRQIQSNLTSMGTDKDIALSISLKGRAIFPRSPHKLTYFGGLRDEPSEAFFRRVWWATNCFGVIRKFLLSFGGGLEIIALRWCFAIISPGW